jgi:hypothetical protein
MMNSLRPIQLFWEKTDTAHAEKIASGRSGEYVKAFSVGTKYASF